MAKEIMPMEADAEMLAQCKRAAQQKEAMKKTPWLDGSVKPVRVGPYERKYPDGCIGYSDFACGNWFLSGDTPDEALEEWRRSPYQSLPWRGRAQDPKGKA